MNNITQFYLNKAKYIAVDEQGNSIDLEVDYWGKSYAVSQPNQALEDFASRLLVRKHRVNFVYKMQEVGNK